MNLVKLISDNREVIKKGLIVAGTALAGLLVYGYLKTDDEVEQIAETVETDTEDYKVIEVEPVKEETKL